MLPRGVIFSGQNGIEVQTEQAVFIPAGSASGYGVATVPAKALTAGENGNIQALAVNAVYGTALYVRNLTAFRGGKDSYSVKFVTPQNRQTAFNHARQVVATRIKGLHYPCNESYLSEARQMTVTWRCQFVSYRLPAYMQVTAARLSGRNVLVDVAFVPRPVRLWVK